MCTVPPSCHLPHATHCQMLSLCSGAYPGSGDPSPPAHRSLCLPLGPASPPQGPAARQPEGPVARQPVRVLRCLEPHGFSTHSGCKRVFTGPFLGSPSPAPLPQPLRSRHGQPWHSLGKLSKLPPGPLDSLRGRSRPSPLAAMSISLPSLALVEQRPTLLASLAGTSWLCPEHIFAGLPSTMLQRQAARGRAGPAVFSALSHFVED